MGLYYLDPTTNQITYAWGVACRYAIPRSLNYMNQAIKFTHGHVWESGEIWQVDLTNPSNSTYLQQVPTAGVIISVTSVGMIFYL
ncbi:MAG: hypothetical protein R2788_17980 [Saprospiraceae bacterium]